MEQGIGFGTSEPSVGLPGTDQTALSVLLYLLTVRVVISPLVVLTSSNLWVKYNLFWLVKCLLSNVALALSSCGPNPCQGWTLSASFASSLSQAGFQTSVYSLPVGITLLWEGRFVKKNSGMKTWLLLVTSKSNWTMSFSSVFAWTLSSVTNNDRSISSPSFFIMDQLATDTVRSPHSVNCYWLTQDCTCCNLTNRFTVAVLQTKLNSVSQTPSPAHPPGKGIPLEDFDV